MRFVGVAVLLIAAIGCTRTKSTRHFRPEICAPAEEWVGVTRVAVLPPDNWTTDIGLEHIPWFRAVVAELLREKGYYVVPLVNVNRFMLKNKFTFAGELGMYDTSELCKELDCDSLFFWDITKGGPTLQIVLVKGDGKTLWASGEIQLGLKYKTYMKGRYRGSDERFALALGETLRKVPERVP